MKFLKVFIIAHVLMELYVLISYFTQPLLSKFALHFLTLGMSHSPLNMHHSLDTHTAHTHLDIHNTHISTHAHILIPYFILEHFITFGFDSTWNTDHIHLHTNSNSWTHFLNGHENNFHNFLFVKDNGINSLSCNNIIEMSPWMSSPVQRARYTLILMPQSDEWELLGNESSSSSPPTDMLIAVRRLARVEHGGDSLIEGTVRPSK